MGHRLHCLQIVCTSLEFHWYMRTRTGYPGFSEDLMSLFEAPRFHRAQAGERCGVLGEKECLFSTLALSIDYPRNLRPMSPEHGTCLPQIATAIHLKRVAHKTQGAQGKVCWPAATQHSYLPGRGSEFNNPARPAQSDWHLRHPA